MNKSYPSPSCLRSSESLGELRKLCKDLKLEDKIMVEVGCYTGESTVIFAENCKTLYAIDPWKDGMSLSDGTTQGENLIMFPNVEKTFDNRMKPYKNVAKIKAFDYEVMDKFENESLDFVYIDALHTEDEMNRQIDAWLPKIKKGGAIGGHDFNSHFQGIVNAVKNKLGNPDKVYYDGGNSWIKYKNPMPLHFIVTGKDFYYPYYLAVLTAIKTQKITEANIWITEDIKSEWLDLLKDKVQIKKVPCKKFIALEGQPDYFIKAHTKDYLTYKVLYENGGICLDLDTLSIKDITHLLQDKEMVVPSDAKKAGDFLYHYNSAILVGKKESPLLQEALKIAEEKLSNKDGVRWGMTGPILISEIVFKNTDKVFTPEFGVCGGYDGYGIRDFYKDEKMQIDPKICIVHLFAVACNKFANLFDNITPSSIKNGNSLLARTIKSILTSEEYDPFKKVFVEIGSNYFDTLVHLAKDNWRGVIVEAVPEYFDKIEKVEGVSYENVVIGDKIGNVSFYYIPQETIIEKKLPDWARGLGSLNKKHPIVVSNGWENLVKEITIPMITVKALLDKYSINHIDYLKIDTEGSDCNILQKFDLSKIDKIVFEHKHCSKEDMDRELKRMGEYGFKYEFVGDNVKSSKRSELMLNSKKKYRFHLLGLVHLPCSKKYMSCAFTQKNWKLAKMLLDLGHEVYYYGAEGSELPCTEFIQTHTLADIRKEWGDGDNRFEIGYDWPKTDFRHDFNTEKTETTKKFYNKCIEEINARKKEDDFLLITQGCYQIPVRNGVKLFLNCEPGIGYRGSVEGNYRAFESSYIQNFTYGSQHPYECINGSYYDRVIPNYFDEKDVEFNANPTGDYFFFIGRMIRRKGIIVAHLAAKALGKKLIIAGQGAEVKDGHLISEDFNLEPGTWEYVGYANVEERKKLMKNAIATFTPTEYLECFAGTHIESMLHGTPAITTDFGVFPGTVINGVNGYRCSTLDDFVNAAKKVSEIDRNGVRKSADRYLMDYVKWEYQKWFDDLYAVYESAMDKSVKGWSRIREEDPEWREKLTR